MRLTNPDKVFKAVIKDILYHGYTSQQARPKYSNGVEANSRYILGYSHTYNLHKGEFPITTLRPIAWQSAIKEMLWIYQDQSNSLSLLRDKYGVTYWDSWDIGDGTIGKRYGHTVKKHRIIDDILKQLEDNPYNRRNVISLWDYESFTETEGLKPCAFNFMLDVEYVGEELYLTGTLIQRSNDLLVAHHINAIQYVALQMMIAKHFGWKLGSFNYFVNNIHIYNNQYDIAEELLSRPETRKRPRLVLNVPDGTNFYDIKYTDFTMVDYKPTLPNFKFDLAI